MADRKEERSIGELFSELANETTTLVRQEVQLAKIEVREMLVSNVKAAMIDARVRRFRIRV